jgi:hypothetical protein
MKTKFFYKFALIVPAFVGLSLMAYTPNERKANETKKESQAVEKVITVDKLVHDFGTVSENGGDISAVFVVKNNTDAPVVLTNVRASCGCTTPSWTKEPIEPGKTGEVTATYSPKGRPGPFDKSVTITTNGNPERLIVHIKGTVE